MKLKTQRTERFLCLTAIAMTAAGCASDAPPALEPPVQAAPSGV